MKERRKSCHGDESELVSEREVCSRASQGGE
jgi:hypothetical protein